MLDREEEAEGFALLEPHSQIRPREFPVHRERERDPVRLYNGRERLNSVLELIRRPRYPQVVTRRRPDDCSDVEGEDATSEMALRKRFVSDRAVFIFFEEDLNIVFTSATVPFGLEGCGTKNLPPVGVRNRKRQASVGVRTWRLVHPLSTIRRRTYVDRTVIGQVALEVYGGNPLENEIKRRGAVERGP